MTLQEEIGKAIDPHFDSGDGDKMVIAASRVAKEHTIDFANWLRLLDNGAERYNPITKETSHGLGFSPFDAFTDDIMTTEELYNKWLKENIE